MLAQSTKQPSVSLGADDMAFDWDMQNQRLSVDDKAVDLNMKLTDIFAPCKDSFEEWMLSSWGAKYQARQHTGRLFVFPFLANWMIINAGDNFDVGQFGDFTASAREAEVDRQKDSSQR